MSARMAMTATTMRSSISVKPPPQARARAACVHEPIRRLPGFPRCAGESIQSGLQVRVERDLRLEHARHRAVGLRVGGDLLEACAVDARHLRIELQLHR